MKRKIVLVGKDRTGKTSTLKIVIRELLNAGAKVLYSSSNFSRFIRGLKAGDIWVIFEYNGQIIYVTTCGDCRKVVLNSFVEAKRISNFIDDDIDIYIGACHPKYTAKETIESFSGTFERVDKTARDNEIEQSEVNNADAQRIVSMI